MAYIEDASGTHGMLKLLDKILRYHLDQHEMVTLAKEMDTMESILELSRYRFGNFTYKVIWNVSKGYEVVTKYSLIELVTTTIADRQKQDNVFGQLEIEVYLDMEDSTYKVKVV